MPVSYEEFKSTDYFRSLDALRCISILAVLWHHAAESTNDVTIATKGYLGVDLFFVLSGFLITTLLLREHNRIGSISLRNFYLRRVLRIFPLYYSFLLSFCVWTAVVHGSTTRAARFFAAVPFYLTFTTNWMPEAYREPQFERAWSLAVEEQFYLLWPALLVVCGGGSAFRVVLMFWLFAHAADLGLLGDGLLVAGRCLSPFAAIAIGVMAAMSLDRATGFRVAARVLGHRFSVMLVAALLVVLLAIPGPVASLRRLAIHLCMAALVTTVVISDDHWLIKPFRHPWLVHVGVVSYGIYVVHGQFTEISRGILERGTAMLGTPGLRESRFAQFLVLTAISVFVASVSFRFFESFFVTWRRRLSASRREDERLSVPPR